MVQLSRRQLLVAAGAAAVSLAGCGDGGESTQNQDLSGNREGAMTQYGVGDQFKATAPISFSLLYNNHPNYQLKEDWLFWTELAKRTGVTLEKVAVPLSDYEQKRSVLVGAGDAPFIMPKTYHPQEDAFVSSGAILPVSDYLDLMPNFKDKITKWNLKPEIDTLRQEDGKFYLLPGIHEKPWHDYSLAVRTDILEQLNIPVPATWDEVYTMLKAMKTAYPDSYPFSDRFSKPTPGGNLLNILAKSYGTMGGWDYQHTTWDAGASKFVYTGAMSQYRDMLQYLNKLVTEGLMDPESFTQTDDSARQKLAGGKSFVISSNAQTLVNDYRKDLAATLPNARMTKIVLPIGPAGAINPTSRLENGVMLSKKARESKNFVAMMQFVDWLWYSDAGMEFAKWGIEGTTFTKDASGKRTLASDIDVIGLNPAGTKHLQKDFGFYNGVFAYGGPLELVQSFFSPEEMEFQKVLNARPPIPVAPPHPFSDEEREQVSLWETPLKDYVTQMSLKFILGQRSLGEWDAYVNELKSKNMDSYLNLVNKAHERYQKANG
ncbi:carbohydrate ABC transporter substrate-binding protein (CUT1 family) [Micromonospora pisi]|uniref:Carbohydrate ABC transporter substrate-binding protein (CUT1 family) n=1 Tax=Micromonospora pisi TaxID=589240 RepID=A0A495JDH6_9ACTN|nr:extracellular solute-binding protein [Micromonospora pisi]RKR86412.1 carbohydrate ABC transporter substrate-binding protein (CUT1 family) [Micromonospora pisi]